MSPPARAEEGAEAIVGVHPEGVGPADVGLEGDADMEADVVLGAPHAHLRSRSIAPLRS